ncbi:MAG: PP2C family protein-serine/threonine phosphatase [Candidatus Omnitrophota bacterium]
MEEKKGSPITHLKKELKRKEFQFDSIYEFSESIYSSFHVESIIRIYFSTLMGQLGVFRIFFYDSENGLFYKRGFKFAADEEALFLKQIKHLNTRKNYLKKVDDLQPKLGEFKALLLDKKIQYLFNISESKSRSIVLGLSAKLNHQELSSEHIEYTYFVSKFAAGAIEHAVLVNRLIQTKRMEHEFEIARKIQLSLLPQAMPQLKNIDISVRYQPTFEVGGDYYDIMKERRGELPILIADVEGKGLPAALLAVSSQAVFRSLSELYYFEAGKFVAKANELIYDFTRGNRFITLFWMLLNDAQRTLTYVNAGHIEPVWISGDTVRRLERGGILTGFVHSADFETETILLQPGDIVAAFTDGVPEVENKAGDQFGVEPLIEFLKANRHLSAEQLNTALYQAIHDFSQNQKFRDDFTLVLLKVRA